MIIGHGGLNPDFDSDIDQKVDFQEFLNFTEPIITKWVDISLQNGNKRKSRYFSRGLLAVDQNQDGEVSKSEAAYFVEHLNISLTIRWLWITHQSDHHIILRLSFIIVMTNAVLLNNIKVHIWKYSNFQDSSKSVWHNWPEWGRNFVNRRSATEKQKLAWHRCIKANADAYKTQVHQKNQKSRKQQNHKNRS